MVRTGPDFLAWCKANPTQANYGSPAAGSIPHFLGVLLGRAGGVDFQHVAFCGSQPAMIDMMGGQVAAVSGPVGEFLPHLTTGKVRMLPTSGATRSSFMTDVPTYTEQGFKNLEFTEWFGVTALAKVARPVRWLNVPVGAWIAISPWVLSCATSASAWIDVTIGLGIIGLRLPLGSRSDEHYGGWDRAII